MRQTIIGMAAALVLVGAPIASADMPSNADGDTLSQSDFQVLTDARIAVVKAALQLTPDQQNYWPNIEQAIRARAEARFRRLSALVARTQQQRSEVDPLELIRARAYSLDQRADGLKRLADAWQPLYQTLTPDQKARMRLVTARVMGAIWARVENRRCDLANDGDDDC